MYNLYKAIIDEVILRSDSLFPRQQKFICSFNMIRMFLLTFLSQFHKHVLCKWSRWRPLFTFVTEESATLLTRSLYNMIASNVLVQHRTVYLATFLFYQTFMHTMQPMVGFLVRLLLQAWRKSITLKWCKCSSFSHYSFFRSWTFTKTIDPK